MKKTKTLAPFLAGLIVIAASCQSGKDAFQVGVTDLTGGNVGEVKLESGDTYAVMSIRDFGDITFKLLPECAPIAVQNFIDLANEGYYDGKNFHRIIAGFMIQGGSPNGDGGSDPNEETFGVELAYNARHFYGALCMANSMGRNSQQFYIVNSKEPDFPENLNADSVKSDILELQKLVKDSKSDDERMFYQSYLDSYRGKLAFFENLTDEAKAKYKNGGASFLDGGYTVFGQTVEGFGVLDAVSSVEVELADNGVDETPSKPVNEVIIESVKIYTFEG